ncbi:MAG: DUF748 domain-containing protein, partial [Algisphaera sp.]
MRPKAKTSLTAPRPRRWRRRLLIATPIVLALYALVGFFGMPWALQRWAVPAANDTLNGTLAVNQFRCNPFSLSLTAEGVSLHDTAHAKILGIDRFYGNLQASSLIRRGWVFRAIELDRPFVSVELLDNGRLNLAGLAKPADPTAPQTVKPAPAAPHNGAPPAWPRLRVGRFAVTDAHLIFADQFIAAQPFHFEINPLTFTIPKLDTLADHENPHRLHAVADDGAEFDWEGTVFLNPLTSDGRLILKGVDLSRFQPYVGRFSQLHLTQGTLALDVTYGLAPADAAPRVGIDLKSLTLKGLRVEQDDASVVDGLNFSLDGLAVDAVAHTATLQRVALTDAALHVIRLADGTLPLVNAVAVNTNNNQASVPAPPVGPPQQTTPQTTTSTSAPAPPDPTDPTTPTPAAETPPAPWTPIVDGIDRIVNDLLEAWNVQVTAVAIERTALRFTDASTPTPADVRLHNITLNAGPIHSSQGYAVPFTASLAQTTTDNTPFE